MASGTVTKNSCRLCMPLGACLAFKGIEKSMTLLHGGQGCATYIRRYMIGHFREPVDIGSSSFSEETAVFGGKENLFTSLDSLIARYRPSIICIATTCVSETIGENLGMYLHEYRVLNDENKLPLLVHVSTPSYESFHGEGYWRAVTATLQALGKKTDFTDRMTIIPGMVSPADIREIKSWMKAMDIPITVFPDYSETLDSGPWPEYEPIASGGTSLQAIEEIPNSSLCLEFSGRAHKGISPAAMIEETWRIPSLRTATPVGIRLTDSLFELIEKFYGRRPCEEILKDRQRLIDLYVDGHKFAYGKRFALYGDEDMVIGIASFLCEAGFSPALVAVTSYADSAFSILNDVCGSRLPDDCILLNNADFVEIETQLKECDCANRIDFMIGNSRGHKIAMDLCVPLVRIGFPVHDRIGAAHILTVGYRGTAELYTRIINALIEREQTSDSYHYGTY